jgi:hypothetical protein
MLPGCGDIVETSAVLTVLDIEVSEPGTKHAISLQQVERWLDGATTSPNEASVLSYSRDPYGCATLTPSLKNSFALCTMTRPTLAVALFLTSTCGEDSPAAPSTQTAPPSRIDRCGGHLNFA